MKNILLSLMFLFPASGAMAQDKPVPKKTQSIGETIDDLINELGDDSYEVREKAQVALEKIGKPALKALRKALKGKDLEVSSRAQELIEKITGLKRRDATPKKRDMPSVPHRGPESPLNPGDMKEMLDKLEDFGGLSPNLKKTLDSFRKILEGNQEMDLGELGKLFEDLFDKKIPGMPQQPEAAPKPEVKTATTIEQQLGIETKPVSDVLKAHLPIRNGIVLGKVGANSHAFAQGLRPYDIILHVGNTSAPKVQVTSPRQLESLKTTKLYIKVMRKGKTQVIVVNPLPKPTPKAKGKNRDF